MVATSSRLLALLLALALPLFAGQGEPRQQGSGDERLRELRTRMEQESQQATVLRARLETQQVDSVAAWHQRAQDLAEYRRLLASLQQLRSDFEAAGGSTSAAAGSLQADLAWCDAALRALDADHPRLLLMELDQDYRDLQRERRRLQNEYMRAYGTSQARIAMQNMRVVLSAMRDNRLAAQRAGSAAAASELAQLDRDLQRLR